LHFYGPSEETNKLSLQSVNAGAVLLNQFVIAQSIIIGRGRTCLIYEHSGEQSTKAQLFYSFDFSSSSENSSGIHIGYGILNSNKSCVCLCLCECDGNSWQSYCAITTHTYIHSGGKVMKCQYGQ